MSLMEMSVSGAVLILVILAVRAALWDRLPKRTFVALWLVALIRLLVPVSVPSAWSAYSLMQNMIAGNTQQSGAGANLRQQSSQAQDQADYTAEFTAEYAGTDTFSDMPPEEITENTSEKMTSASGTASAEVWLRTILQAGGTVSGDAPNRPILQAVWVVGGLAGMLFFGWVYCGCFREFQMSLPMEDGFLRNWLETHSLRRKLSIRRSDRIASPLSYGIRRPVILLPKSVKGSDRFRLRYILEHEFVHILRFDAAVKLFMAAALCVHWFNPLVYLMYIFFNRDLEFACDEEVVRRFGEEEKAAYAMALIEMEEEKSGLHPLGNHFSKNAIEERIGAIMKMKKMPRAVHVLSIAVVLSVTLLFATSSKAAGAAENTAKQEKQVQKEIEEQIQKKEKELEKQIPGKKQELEEKIRMKEKELNQKRENVDQLVMEIEQMREEQESLRLAQDEKERQKFFEENYGNFGIHYNLSDYRLYQNETPIRFFIDRGGPVWADNEGEIVVRVLYDEKGKVSGLFAEDAEDAAGAVDVTEASKTGTEAQGEAPAEAAYAISRSDEYPTYKKFGLSYNRRTGYLMYKDKTVGYFKDEVSPGVYTRFVEDSGQLAITVKRNSSGKVVGFSAVPLDEISLSGGSAEEGSAVIIQQAEDTESTENVTIFSGRERSASTSETTGKQ